MKTVTEHQPRERAVPCRTCRRETWNVNAVCDSCECPQCHGDRIVEEPCGPRAAEATRPIRCPRCGDGKPLRSAS